MPILAVRPSTRSLHDLRKRVFCIFTHRQTDGQRDSMSESAQWADTVNKLWINKTQNLGRTKYIFYKMKGGEKKTKMDNTQL